MKIEAGKFINKHTSLTLSVATDAAAAYEEYLAQKLLSGERFVIRGVGSFKWKWLPSRIIPASVTPHGAPRPEIRLPRRRKLVFIAHDVIAKKIRSEDARAELESLASQSHPAAGTPSPNSQPETEPGETPGREHSSHSQTPPHPMDGTAEDLNQRSDTVGRVPSGAVESVLEPTDLPSEPPTPCDGSQKTSDATSAPHEPEQPTIL